MNAIRENNISSESWKARLELEYTKKAQRTVLSKNVHIGPLAVQRPLYPEGEVCHSYILHPPGGVVGGDLLEIDVQAKSGVKILITTPGATKFYRSGGRTAVQDQRLLVKEGAVLEWFPQDTILFSGAEAEISTRVELESSAVFMGWEVTSLGLPAVGKRFDKGSLVATLSVSRDGVPLLLERLRVSGEQDLDSPAGLRSFPVTATFVSTGGSAEMLEPLRKLMVAEEKALYGVTLMDDLLVARYLGYSSFAARELFGELWRLLRPEVIGLDASPPRIWNT